MILIRKDYPDRLYSFQRGSLRWGARLLACHASLVHECPPFALDTKPVAPATGTATTPRRKHRIGLGLGRQYPLWLDQPAYGLGL